MDRTPRRPTKIAPPKEADAALLETLVRLRSARSAIADLMTMENARTGDLHADDDHIRRMIRSLETKRRRLTRSGAEPGVTVVMDAKG